MAGDRGKGEAARILEQMRQEKLATARRVLAEHTERARAERSRVLQQPEPAKAKVRPSSADDDDILEPFDAVVTNSAGQAVQTTMVSPRPDTQQLSATERIKKYMEDYQAAQQEIERQRQQLIALRGGEDLLTESDMDALKNVWDMLEATYEHLLEK